MIKNKYNMDNQEGSKRITVPMDKIEHINEAIDIFTEVKVELEKVSRQKIPVYLRLLHARNVISWANFILKSKAGDDSTEGSTYKGAV